MKRAVFQLEALTCPSCIKKIETKYKKTTGISSSKVLFNSGKVRAEFDEGQIEVAAIGDIITKLGYVVLSKKVYVAFTRFIN